MTTKNLSSSAMRTVLAFVFRHWRRELRLVLWVALSMGVATLADLIVPIYSGRMVDAVVPHGVPRAESLHIALRSIAIIAVLGLGLLAGRYAAFYSITRLTSRLMTRLAANAFWRVQRFSTDWHANSFAGSIVRRITRGMWALDLMNDTLLLALLPAVLVLIGSSVILGLRWPLMGAIIVIGSACYITLSVTLNLNYVAPSARLNNAQDTRLGGALADSITCNAVVKSFGAENREDHRLSKVLDKWRSRTQRTWLRGTFSGTVQLVTLLGLRTVVTAAAVYLWWRGRATPGDVTFVLTSYLIIHGYLRDIGNHVANLQRSVNEMEEMVSLESQPLGIADKPDAKPIHVHAGEIVFDRVTFLYQSRSEPLFDNLSLRIRAGERVGLVGHSGSGKSTFVKLLHRLYDINSGSITVDGQEISHVTQASLRWQLALVPQEPILFHRSLAENISYGRPNATLREIEEAAELANAHHFIVRQPKAYHTLVGERGVKLSGGERQRIALARAFLANTPILILDEATSSLDSESEALIQEAMERLITGRTAIVIAHRLSTVRMLDRILVFDDGRIAEEGPHDLLIQKLEGIYKRLFERQALGLITSPATAHAARLGSIGENDTTPEPDVADLLEDQEVAQSR